MSTTLNNILVNVKIYVFCNTTLNVFFVVAVMGAEI